MSAAGESARGVAAARRALAAIESDADLLAAARAVLPLVEGLREVAEEAAALRQRIVATILERGLMTRAELAEYLEVTPQRISQIRRGWRRPRR